MKYPKAGDLQRQLGVEVAGNPSAQRNPWEVRSDSGLEGVFAEEDEARFYAEEIRGSGAHGVIVESRKRLHPRLQQQNPAGRSPGWEHASRTITSMAQNIESIGVDGCNSLLKYVAVLVDGVSYGWLLRCEPNGRDVTVELTDGTVEKFDAQQVWPMAGRVPESPTLLALRAKWKVEDEEEARGRGNPSSRLFSGVYPTGIVYADKARERDGDYLRVAFLPFSTLQLEWSPGQHPAELRAEIERDAAEVIARRGEQYPVSSSGQTVTLGNPGLRAPSWRQVAGISGDWNVEQQDQYGNWKVTDYDVSREYAEKTVAWVEGKGGTARASRQKQNPPRVTRERYGDDSEIVIEHNRYGYTGWLESKRGGGRLPISFGATRPTNAREAVELAKKFLAGVYGKSNPAGLTAKGERMYEHIKAGYGDDPRAAEIASRTVLAKAKSTRGLKK